MYEHRPELKAKGKFPITQIYQGKLPGEAVLEMTSEEVEDRKILLRKQAQQLKAEDAQGMGEANKAIEEEQQKPEEVSPKDKVDIPISPALKEGSNSESTTQKEEPMVLNEGYIKAYRKTIKSRVFKNEGLFKIWMWCLFKASHTEQWVTIKTGRGSTEVHLLPGQFVFGRKKAAKELNMKEPTVQKRIKKLENMGNCISQSIRHCSVVTVANWEFYQGSKQKVSGKVSTKYQPSITYKNDKKKDIYCLNSNEFQLSELLLNLILERRNSFKRPDLEKWTKHVDLMVRIDKRKPEEIENVIKWCQQDAFWQNNILSTGKLRKQFDQLALKMEEEIEVESERDGWDI